MRFKSKQNRVVLEAGIVFKIHKDRARLLCEIATLKILDKGGVAVPSILGVDENVLKLEYIPGPTYVELVDNLSLEQAVALTKWLASFHIVTGHLRGDCNLRNFLWSQGRCVGIDFEDLPVKGELEQDLGKVLAFAVTYDPIFSKEKVKTGNLLLGVFRQMGGSKQRIKDAYLEEIVGMTQRRKNFTISHAEAASFFDSLNSEKIQT